MAYAAYTVRSYEVVTYLYHRSLRQKPFTMHNISITFQDEVSPTKVGEILSSFEKEGLMWLSLDEAYTRVF